MFCEEDFERMQLLGHTLDVVQAVDTNNELDALELLLERSNSFLDLGFLEAFVELLRVNSDGEGTNRDDLALELDAIRRCCKTPVLSQHLTWRLSRVTYSMREQLLRKWRA